MSADCEHDAGPPPYWYLPNFYRTAYSVFCVKCRKWQPVEKPDSVHAGVGGFAAPHNGGK